LSMASTQRVECWNTVMSHWRTRRRCATRCWLVCS
jgi:hypothetical protein